MFSDRPTLIMIYLILLVYQLDRLTFNGHCGYDTLAAVSELILWAGWCGLEYGTV